MMAHAPMATIDDRTYMAGTGVVFSLEELIQTERRQVCRGDRDAGEEVIGSGDIGQEAGVLDGSPDQVKRVCDHHQAGAQYGERRKHLAPAW
jgi:hypothetical protein